VRHRLRGLYSVLGRQTADGGDVAHELLRRSLSHRRQRWSWSDFIVDRGMPLFCPRRACVHCSAPPRRRGGRCNRPRNRQGTGSCCNGFGSRACVCSETTLSQRKDIQRGRGIVDFAASPDAAEHCHALATPDGSTGAGRFSSLALEEVEYIVRDNGVSANVGSLIIVPRRRARGHARTPAYRWRASTEQRGRGRVGPWSGSGC
jgi:hypothetical protein